MLVPLDVFLALIHGACLFYSLYVISAFLVMPTSNMYYTPTFLAFSLTIIHAPTNYCHCFATMKFASCFMMSEPPAFS